MKKMMGAIMVSAALGILPWGTGNASAADFAVPHTFRGGDVVSADELNERFDNLEQMQKDFTATDLVGTWSCPVVASYSNVGWTLSQDGLTMSSTIGLTFTQSGGTLYLSSTCPPPVSGNIGWTPYSVCPTSGPLVNQMVQLLNGSVLSPYGVIKKRSNTRFEFSAIPGLLMFNTNGSLVSSTGVAYCDKQSIPPLKPSNLAASVSGTSITLTWTDNSADETGFDVLRKDTASGTYAVVGSVSANTTTYQNTSVSSGTHWYRVRATNANGSSLGSNAVKVTN